MGPAQQKLFEHAQAIQEETGWSLRTTLDHQRKYAFNEWNAAVKERARERAREDMADPGKAILDYAKAYSDAGNVTKEDLKRAVAEHSNVGIAWDRNLKVYHLTYPDPLAELEKRASEHMSKTGEKNRAKAYSATFKADRILERDYDMFVKHRSLLVGNSVKRS